MSPAEPMQQALRRGRCEGQKGSIMMDTPRKKIAVITGASSGLGEEFVRQLDEATRGERPLLEERPEELWVIARREERLQQLSKVTEIPLRVLPLDLTRRESVQVLQDLLEEEWVSVRLLINAAGCGRVGRTEGMERSELDKMIELNCRAAVDVTQVCLPYMTEGARILEICSIAAFLPLSRLNVYAATKAFLYRYSRALRVELLPRKISVTAVCPYWIQDTEFIGIANGADGNADGGIRSYPFADKKERVVHHALTDAALGMPVSTPGAVSTVTRFVRKLLPSDLLLAAWELIRRL